MRILKNFKTRESYLQIITLTVNSAFKEGTQGACDAQDRFCAKFQAPYVKGMDRNERFSRSLAFRHPQIDFLQRLPSECVENSTYVYTFFDCVIDTHQ